MYVSVARAEQKQLEKEKDRVKKYFHTININQINE